MFAGFFILTGNKMVTIYTVMFISILFYDKITKQHIRPIWSHIAIYFFSSCLSASNLPYYSQNI